jgi:hypothetical protein
LNSIERFKKQKKTQKNIEHRKDLGIAADQSLVRKFLDSEVDINAIQASTERLNAVYDFQPDLNVSDQEVDDLLQFMEKDFNDQRFNELIAACKKDVISAIVIPFGIGRYIAKFDKDGGNVTTINNANARQGTYARDEDKYIREEYTHSKNSEGQAFAGQGKKSAGSEFTKNQLDENQTLVDAYTGKRELGSNTSPDHIISNSEFHKNGGFMLSSKRKADFATDEGNLASTRRDINQSMSDHDNVEWMEKKQNGREKTNAEHYDIDPVLLKQHYEAGKNTAKKHQPDIVEKTKHYGERITATGTQEGANMGQQQAIGLVTYKFFDAVFDEVHDIYKNGYSHGSSDDRFLSVLKKRLTRISKRIAARWKDVGAAFAGGFISGFLSNLVTVVINMFVTTGKRIVRIIREGFYSLLKAVKMICFPPEGMTAAQAAHEASKLVATGLVVTGGVALEQYIDTMIKAIPFIAPFADILTTILVGGLTGLAITFVVYAIDKIDFFNVNDDEKHKFIMNRLETNLEKMFAEGEVLIAEMGL